MKCYVLRVRYEGVHGSARILPAAFAVLRGLEAALLSPTSMNPRQSILPGIFAFTYGLALALAIHANLQAGRVLD